MLNLFNHSNFMLGVRVKQLLSLLLHLRVRAKQSEPEELGVALKSHEIGSMVSSILARILMNKK